jgi:hypothetical protein
VNPPRYYYTHEEIDNTLRANGISPSARRAEQQRAAQRNRISPIPVPALPAPLSFDLVNFPQNNGTETAAAGISSSPVIFHSCLSFLYQPLRQATSSMSLFCILSHQLLQGPVVKQPLQRKAGSPKWTILSSRQPHASILSRLFSVLITLMTSIVPVSTPDQILNFGGQVRGKGFLTFVISILLIRFMQWWQNWSAFNPERHSVRNCPSGPSQTR